MVSAELSIYHEEASHGSPQTISSQGFHAQKIFFFSSRTQANVDEYPYTQQRVLLMMTTNTTRVANISFTIPMIH